MSPVLTQVTMNKGANVSINVHQAVNRHRPVD